MKNLGQQIRAIREQRGIGLTEYAHKLGVSVGYLSNLETGKTDTIQLSLLEKLHKDLNLTLVPNQNETEDHELHTRFQRLHQLIMQLMKENPQAAEYLLSTVEKGAYLFTKQTS